MTQGRLCLLAAVLVSLSVAPRVPAEVAEVTEVTEVKFRLVDGAGRSVSEARVSVVGRAGSVRTSADGSFRLEPIPLVPFELAAADGRGTWLGILRVTSLPAGGLVVLSLPEQREAEVLVRAGLAPASSAPPAAAATVVSRPEIDERRPSHLAEVLDEIPGSGRLEEGSSVVPTLRGLARGRTLILLDDARVTAERRAGPSATFLDPFALENLEVVRGPGSVAYGSDALGGVLHARTPMPRAEAFAGRYELSAGTKGEATAGALEANVPMGQAAVLVGAHQRFAADYRSAGGTIDNSAARDRGFLVRVLVPAGTSRLWAGIQVDEGADIGKPSADSNVTRAYYPKEASSRFTLGADLGTIAGFTSLELRGFLGSYRLITDRDRLPAPAAARMLSRADVFANDFSLRATAARPLLAGVLITGLDVNGRYGLRATGMYVDYDAASDPVKTTDEVAVDSARRVDWGAFVETDQPLVRDRLSVAAGVRGDLVGTRNLGGYFGDASRSEGAFSGFAALTVTPADGLSATFQYARGFRDPTLSDRYFRGVSGRGFVVGNPELAPEKSDQLDLAVRLAVGPARLAAYGFLYSIRDLVERYRKGSDYLFRNRGREELRGAELEADLALAPGLTGRVAATWLRGEIVDDGSPAADVPPPSVTLSLDHKVSEKIWWRARYGLYSSDDRPGPTEVATPGYGILDASLGYRLTELVGGRLILRNVLDKSYLGSADALSVTAPGRSVSLVLSGSL